MRFGRTALPEEAEIGWVAYLSSLFCVSFYFVFYFFISPLCRLMPPILLLLRRLASDCPRLCLFAPRLAS